MVAGSFRLHLPIKIVVFPGEKGVHHSAEIGPFLSAFSTFYSHRYRSAKPPVRPAGIFILFGESDRGSLNVLAEAINYRFNYGNLRSRIAPGSRTTPRYGAPARISCIATPVQADDGAFRGHITPNCLRIMTMADHVPERSAFQRR